MLSVMSAFHKEKQLKPKELKKAYQRQDIIVTRVEYDESIDEKGVITIKPVEKKVNLTKMVNETKKVIKTISATEKIESLQKELLNKGVL